MLIQNFLKTLTKLGKSNGRRRLPRPHDLSEQLESRTLLTGNVQVSLSGANAQITGDAGNNELEIVVDNSSIVVRGLNGTTINQGTTAFTLVTGSTSFGGSLTASLGAGDDLATVGPGITFGGNVSIAGQGGADTFQVRTGTYNGNLSLRGGDGASSIVVDGATVSGSLNIDGQGAMVVSITNSTVRGQLDVKTGRENSPDSIVIKATTVDKKTTILTGKGDDNVALQNSHFNGQLIMYTGAGNDVVYIDGSSVGKLSLIATQRGDDMLQVLNSSSFSRLMVFAGGIGHDGASIAGDTTARRVIKGSQQAKYFEPATIASRITAPTTGAIAVADALRNAAVPMLTVTTTAGTFAENAGTSATTLTVTRTGPTTSDLVVTLASSNTSKATVPATITILAGQTTATATIAAVDNTLSDADAVVTFTASAAGLVSGTRNVTVTNNDAAALTLTANQTTVSEGAGATAVTYTVSRNTSDLSAPLTVTLDDGTSGRLTVGNTVVIPANQASITFPGAAIENTIVDGSTDVLVTATATSFANGTATVEVTDNEPATLMVTSNIATVAENAAAGALVYTVSRNTADTSAALTVNVSSGTPRLTLASATVTIPVGQSSVTLIGTPDNNLLADGNVPAVITATATGFVTGTATVTVTDDDSELSITAAPGSVSESAAAESVTYTLSRNTVNVAQAPALIVNLASGTPGRLTVANSTVTIPAGQESVTFKGSPVPNTVADGNASVVVTASAAGFTDGTASVTVNDDDSALTVTTTTPTIAENAAAGAVKYRVTRNSVDKTQPLTVSIVSGTPSRLTVTSASVTIPANAEFIEFTGSPVDTTTADGNATVVVTASASGFVNGTGSVTVNDDEVPTLALTANPASVFENAGSTAVSYTVTRNTSDLTSALTVNLTSGTPGRLTVGSTVVIPIGAASATFPGAAVDNSVVDGNASVVVTAAAAGFVNGTATVTVNDNDAGTLSLVPNVITVAENALSTALTYTITRAGTNNSQALIVNLVSSKPGNLTVPATVTIAANATSATFQGTPVVDGIVAGNIDVIVTASASGLANTTATVSVTNVDTAALRVTPTTSAVRENAGSAAPLYTVSRNTADLTLPLTVDLASGNAARLGVPASVTIPVGQRTAVFRATPVNNSLADGDSSVVLTASATALPNATSTVTVLDDEAATAPPGLAAALSVSSLAETAPAESTFLTVTRPNGNTTQALVVDLTYSDASRVSGPATITIPVGGTSAFVPISTIDNLAVDGNIDAYITATAAGFAAGQATLRIIDNEVATLNITTATSSVSESSGTLAGTVATSLASSTPIVVSLSYQVASVLTGPAFVVIPAGATSVPVSFTIVNGGVADQSVVAAIAADAVGAISDETQVTVTDADTLALTATPNTADKVQSNGTIITRNAVAQVSGTTVAGAAISIDSDGDGAFDDGTATAGIDGTYSVNVNVTNTATNQGRNRIVVRAVDGANSADTAVNVHRAVGTVVHFATNVGAYDVELLDSEAGATVTNFLSYVTSGAYQNIFVHRANSGSQEFIQSGSFKVSNSQITSVVTTGTINGQFNPANGNVAGTLAMALTAAGPNSGTSGWFINSIDNSEAFDPGQYTVFGRVIGDGLSVVRQISDLSQANLNTLYSSSALAGVPLTANPANTSITGTVATASGSAIVTGTGTLFTTELAIGDSVVLGSGRAFFVASIQSDTSLTLTQSATSTASGLDVRKDVVPTDAEFVVFSSIAEILDTL